MWDSDNGPIEPFRDGPKELVTGERLASRSGGASKARPGHAESSTGKSVNPLLTALLVGVTVISLTWVVMIVLAARLPPGAARDLATVLPACVTTVRKLRRDPRVPRRAKLAVAFAGVWLVSPIDLIPEFLPVIGPLDDVIVVALALRYAARQVPREAIVEAWPAEQRILDRLLG
jgi:uncharacterized membrane protein YkvA (DUF1232 family)